jgi:hypothetical protein
METRLYLLVELPMRGMCPLIAMRVSRRVRSVGVQESCCSLGVLVVERPFGIACFLGARRQVSDI